MTGGLMQLVATGSQDIYLTSNPQITFFKSIYRRYTNFASEIVEKFFEGTRTYSLQSPTIPGSTQPPIIDFNNSYTVKFSRDGDLINKMYIRLILDCVNPNNAINDCTVYDEDGNNCFAWVRRIGHAIIDEVDIMLGGTVVDRQYGTWLDIWYELARTGDHERGYAKMIGDVPELTEYNNKIKPQYTLYIPMQFWFNRYIGLSIPLIALQYQDVRLHIQFAKKENVIIKSINFDDSIVNLVDGSVLTNYIYLDTEERRIFAQTAHEYLIEQVQFNGTYDVTEPQQRFILDFNHPTKEIIWALRPLKYNNGSGYLYYSSSDDWVYDIDTEQIIPQNIQDASEKILIESVSIGEIKPTPPANEKANWIPVPANGGKTPYKDITIENDSSELAWFNTISTVIGTLNDDNTCDIGTCINLLDKINANLTINKDKTITVAFFLTTITVRDLSYEIPSLTKPTSLNDSRVNNNITITYESDTGEKIKQVDPYIHLMSQYGLLIDGTVNPVKYGQLKLNGHDRFDKREGIYFNNVQPYQHHSNTPKDGINVYSFSLYPEQHQPSGTANLSRIDDTQLILWFGDPSFIPGLIPFDKPYIGQLYVYATNYNILRIMSGMGGLAYSTG